MQNNHTAEPKIDREKILVLVKSVPHASERHGETVCCAGITANGEWRRQYPVRFRQIESDFKRWDWLEYNWTAPKGDDRRFESRRVQEDSLTVTGKLSLGERAKFLNQFILKSTEEAKSKGMSLVLVRPSTSKFYWKERSVDDVKRQREHYASIARQKSFFDKELIALDPCPYAFKYDYTFEDGKKRTATCDDWETTAIFYTLQKDYGTKHALDRMKTVFDDDYPKNGMAFAMGTHSIYPDTWLLVGVIRLDRTAQFEMSL